VRAHIIDGCGGHGQKSKKRRSANTFDLHNIVRLWQASTHNFYVPTWQHCPIDPSLHRHAESRLLSVSLCFPCDQRLPPYSSPRFLSSQFPTQPRLSHEFVPFLNISFAPELKAAALARYSLVDCSSLTSSFVVTSTKRLPFPNCNTTSACTVLDITNLNSQRRPHVVTMAGTPSQRLRTSLSKTNHATISFSQRPVSSSPLSTPFPH
jgi:hypothetical protein